MRIIKILLWLALIGSCGAQEMDFSNIQQTYRGELLQPQVTVNGQPREVIFRSREIFPSETTFSNIPDALAPSYVSYAFQATSTSALGNMVRLAGSARVADHVEVVMVTWAKAISFPLFAAQDPNGYRHPVTATIYQVLTSTDGTISLLKLEENTARIQVPWRPTTLPNGSIYPYNGYAFKALIPLSASIPLPENCVIAISFNTQSAGVRPIGIPGPYNELNLALSTKAPGIGADLDSDAVFRIKNGVHYYPAIGWGGYGSPMLRLATRVFPLPQPALQSSFQTINAGIYHVRAAIPAENIEADTVLTIAKAPVFLETGGLTKSIADQDPFITITNQSPGLTVDITYNGSIIRPEKPGMYPFAIQVTDRNHVGFLAGNFHLTGISYDQWKHFENHPVGDGLDDPDSDGQVNWLEYAVGGSPLLASQALRIDLTNHGQQVAFRRRREMPQVRVSLEYSTDLSKWLPAETVMHQIDDFWETVSTTSALSWAYFRLRTDVE